MHEDLLFCSCAVHVAGQASQMHLLLEMGGESLLEDATASYQLHGIRRRACCQTMLHLACHRQCYTVVQHSRLP